MSVHLPPVVRLVDRRDPSDRRTVFVSWHAPGVVPKKASVHVDFSMDAGAAEKLRWYLEDYPEFGADPAPSIAAEVEHLMAQLGRKLFTAVFGAGDAAFIWTQAKRDLDALRIEVDADPGDVPGLPWELLRDPSTDRPLVLAAGEFVRVHQRVKATREIAEANQDRLRVLLVICRPEGREDVPFRSVASRLVRSGGNQLPGLDLEVLRPPTFSRLQQVLRDTQYRGQPYHVVHFDGHGTYFDAEQPHADLGESDSHESTPSKAIDGGGVAVSPLRYDISLAAPSRPGRHGYLLFEMPNAPTNQELVDGPTLARLLVESQVPVLVLNACRSGYSEVLDTPESGGDAARSRGAQNRISAYGSLAAEVADAGVPGVVTLRYNVYVVTAAQFVADLYTALLAGRSLGRAATAARQALAADSTRYIGANLVALQDWVVPTIYEISPLTLLSPTKSEQDGHPSGRVRLTVHDTPDLAREVLWGAVPKEPDVGFFGQDETLLALDRAFDEQRIVLLHALAGAGKTSTAAEFARWYAATGGLHDHRVGSGLVLWTSFEHYLPLPRVLDVIGLAFAPLLETNNILWAALVDPAVRRDVVLQVLAAVPVLWVWDNVQTVAGFPDVVPSAWSSLERQRLVDFLREVKIKTRAKVLLTSRRTEDSWLGALPMRVEMPPMPMRERLQLAHAFVRHLAPEIAPETRIQQEVDWRALLRFTGGNPLTISVAVRQALREHVASTEDVERFVTRLQAGAVALEQFDDAVLGRDRSLAASLAYGFGHAFTDAERAVLAVLHLFRHTLDVDALLAMGDPDTADTDAVSVLAGWDRDGLIALLNRTVEAGLLTELGRGYYGIHPALPWFFTGLFTGHIGAPRSREAAGAERAYAHAYAALGIYYERQVEGGQAAEVLPVLRAEEANLLHGLELARAHQMPEMGVGCLQGLKTLYDQTGRDVEWARLVGQVQTDYIDSTTDAPIPGREDQYSTLIGYLIQIASARRDWPTAIRLQNALTDWVRHRATPFLKMSPNTLNATARQSLWELALSEKQLGELLLELDDPGCVSHFQTAFTLAEEIGDVALRAECASRLGDAYLTLPSLQDTDVAEQWHRRSLDLRPEYDRVGRAAAYGSLANVAYNRFLEARAAGAPQGELLRYLSNAQAGYGRALELLPADHHSFRATAHNQLGLVFSDVGDVPNSIHHFQQALHHDEARGNTYAAGRTRYNLALLLAQAGRPRDALSYARAAFDNFRRIGLGARSEASQVQRFIQSIEEEGMV